jgi:sugar transferase (PEP-CTERM/EpsH1 system associated)
VLYLAHRVPYPPDKGDRIRAFHLLRHLARHARVYLACLADEPVDAGVVEALGRYAEQVAVAPLGGWRRWARALGSVARGRTVTEGAFRSPRLGADLRGWARRTPFHATLASSSGMAQYQRLPDLRGIPAVVDLTDVDSQKWYDYAAAGAGPRAWLHRLEGRRLRRLEQELSAWAQAVTVVTQAEAALYRQFAPEAAVHVIGNGVDLDYFRPVPVPEQTDLVFVGALDYRPNVDAANWFSREVWPLVHARRPDARLCLVGRRPAPAVRALAQIPGVEVVGQVPDVRPYVARAAVAVVPLRLARGVQNKVLEALAMGRATVASPTTLAGLQGPATPGVLMASAVQEWVDAVLRLLEDEPLRHRLGSAGRRYVEQHHCWEDCLDPFLDLLGLRDSHGAANPSGAPPTPARPMSTA